MGELTQMVKEIDDNRDQMISQFGFYKTTIFQTYFSYNFIIKIKNFVKNYIIFSQKFINRIW